MTVAALLNESAPVPQPSQCVCTLAAARFCHLVFQLCALVLDLLQLVFHLLHAVDGALHFIQKILCVLHLALQRRQHAFTTVAAPVLPKLKSLVRLGEGGLFLTAGYDGLDPLFQLRTSAHDYGTLFDEGGSSKNILGNACEQLTTVAPVHPIHRSSAGCVDSGKFPHRGIVCNRRPGQDQVAVVCRDFHRTFHRSAGPGRIACPVRQQVSPGIF